MKFAGIARTLLLVVIGALLLAVPAGAATEGVTPLRATVPSGYDAVIGGTDVFWMTQRKSVPEPKIGYSYTNLLMRTSLLDGSKALIKKFDPTDTVTGFPDKVIAGGGYVYVNMTGDGPEELLGSSTAVLRMSRDGSGFQKIATGQSNLSEEDSSVVREHGKRKLNDCGTSVAAELVTNDGSVVIRETTADRNSKYCGRKKNYDHVRFYVLSPTGVTREITTDNIRVGMLTYGHLGDGPWSESDASYGPDDADYAHVLSVVGDRALIAHPGSPSQWVHDLNTGAETGPYKTGISGRALFNVGSLDPFGRVAMSAYSSIGSRKDTRFRHASGVFKTPGDPASFSRVKGFSYLIFCGNHLVSLNAHGASELDPVTLNLIQRIAPVHKHGVGVWADNECSNDYLYMSDRGGKNARFLAYPLG